MAPSRLVKHFAAVSCSVVASCASAGSTVYWWCNLSIPANIDGYYINVETQTYGSVGSVVAGWDINPYGSTNLTWYNAAGTGMMRYPGVTSGSAGNLGQQMAVGGSGVTNDGIPTSFGSGAVTVGVQPGNWRLNSVNYFGFRFIAADGLVHYGHGCCHVGSVITDRTIAYLAYEPTPGAPSCVALACLPCPTDLNGDHATDGADLSELLGNWGPCGTGCGPDLDQSGAVDGADIAALLANWGGCPCPDPNGCW